MQVLKYFCLNLFKGTNVVVVRFGTQKGSKLRYHFEKSQERLLSFSSFWRLSIQGRFLTEDVLQYLMINQI